MLRQGRCGEAVPILSEASKLLGDHPGVWVQLGMAFIGTDQSGSAQECFKKSLGLSPVQAEVWCNLGVIQFHAGETQLAIQSFQKALSLQPNLFKARSNAVRAFYFLGMDREAEALLPATSDRFVLRGQGYREKGELATATEAYRQAIRVLATEAAAPVPHKSRFSLQGARQALLETKVRLDKAHIPFCLLAGTLLGVVREGDLLAHDKDLDICVGWEVDRARLVEALCASGGFSVPWSQGVLPPGRPWHRSFIHVGTGCTLDVFFAYHEGDHVQIGFDDRPVPVLSCLDHFGTKELQWIGRTWLIPDPPESYLVQVYGPGWRQPDPAYDTILSNPRRTPESLPLVLCEGYLRLYLALKEGRRERAMQLAQQIHRRKADPFLAELADNLAAATRAAQ